MASVMEGAVQDLIIADIAPGIEEARLAEDPVFMDVVRSSMGVMRDPRGLGRDWLHQQVFGLGHAGTGHFVDPVGPSEQDTDAVSTKSVATPTAYPGVEEHVHSDYLTRQFELCKYVGNIFTETTILRANELTSTVADVIAFNIRGAASQYARTETAYFYATNETATNNVLGVVGSSVTRGGIADNDVIFNLATGRVRNFYPGQLVEIWNAAGTTRRHRDNATFEASLGEICVVDMVDAISGLITVVQLDNSANPFDSQVAPTDVVVAYRGRTASGADITAAANKTRGPYGLNDWIKGSGSLFDEGGTAIALATYPFFKSVTASINTFLTEEVLNKYFGRFSDAYGGRVDLDCIITTMGVINGFMGGQDGAYRIERNNMTLKTRAGWSVFTYVNNGREVEVKISPNVEKQALFALALKNGNVKRYVPPKLPGAGGDSRFDSDVEFINKAYAGSIFKPYHNSSGLTTSMAEAPWEAWSQFVPDKVQGIKLDTLDEVI